MNEVEKEIEEMINVIPTIKIGDGREMYCSTSINDIVTALYNAGYRKVYGTVQQFDDIVESQRKEIKRLKEENDRLKVDKTVVLSIDKQEIKKEVDKTIKYNVDKIKQQAIKEFAETLKLIFRPYLVREFSTNSIIDSNLVINNLLKEYDIGEE